LAATAASRLALIGLFAGVATPRLAAAMAPLALGARIGAPLSLAAPRDLDERGAATLGLDAEDPAIKQVALTRALAYAKYRASERGKERNRFFASCAQQPQDPYCAIESARMASLAYAPGEPGKRERPPLDKAAILAALREGNFVALRAVPAGHIAYAAASYASYAEMRPAVVATSAFEDCDAVEPALALAAKAEEFFPLQEAIEASFTLYRKATFCATPAAAAKARYRFALLAIWQRRFADAELALEALESSQAGYLLRPRARFWRLYCAGMLGRAEAIEPLQAKLMAESPLAFHNLAANGTNLAYLAKMAGTEPARIALRSALRPEANAWLRAIEALVLNGDEALAGEVADLLAGQIAALEPEVRLYVGALLARAGQGMAEFRLLAQLFQDRPQAVGPASLRLYFPLRYFAELKKDVGADLDPLLVLSLIRQESGFNANARSSAGALGLMQVMPATARTFALANKRKLLDPLVNLAIGTKFLRQSLERFSGDVELTLAGYNAGAERVLRWSRRYPVENRILFLDLIPYKETRDYVAAILRNYYWYLELYGPSAPQQPEAPPRAERVPASVGSAATARAEVPAPGTAVAGAAAPSAAAVAGVAAPSAAKMPFSAISAKTKAILNARAGTRPSAEANR
jgi:soluble lytic murein transglycosylase